MSAADAFGDAEDINIVYSWDPASKTWKRFGPGLPSYFNSLTTVNSGDAYWILAKVNTQLAILD
ncbi:hypothetical protein D3C83_310580 [compost metagenome]